MINKVYWTDKFIKRLAQVGSTMSRQCRNPWTGEQIKVSIRIDDLVFGGRNDIAYLEAIRLLALEDVADLFQARLVKYGQHGWKQARWEKEIRKVLENLP